MLNTAEVHAREEALRQRVRELPDELRKQYYEKAERRIRDPDTYAVLNYLFIAGLHHFYLKRWFRGLLNLSVFCAGVALMIIGMWPFGLALIAAITLLEIYALFRSQIIVRAYNNAVMETLLESLQQHDRSS